MTTRFATLLSVALLVPLAAAQSASDWTVLGSPGISDGDVWCCQIAVDRTGAVYASYQDHSLGPNPASVQRFTNGAWSYVGGKGNASLGTAWYNHLAFDSSGALYLACRDYAVGGKINVRRAPSGVSTSWSTLGPAGISTGSAHYSHIAIGEDDAVYVVYADADALNKATVRRFANGAWTTVGPAGFTPSAANYPSLAVAHDGRVFVAFSDGQQLDTSGEGKVTVMRYDTALGQWQLVGSPGFTNVGGLNVRLALDRNDVPHIVYQEYHQRFTVMRCDGAQWVRLGGSAAGSDRPVLETEAWRQWCSLAFDSQNTPYVAYQLLDNGRKAAVRKFVDPNWVPVGTIGFSAGAADYMAMIVDGDDVPHVVFRDGSVAGRATVMRFAPSPYTYCTGVTSSLGCVPTISATGIPSLSNPAPFTIEASSIISQRAGLLLYSFAPDHQAFGGGGILCLASPWLRTTIQNSGGSATGDDCTGTFSYDFNSAIQSGLNPALVVGATVFAQYYYRDAQNPLGPGLSNALRFRIRP